MKIPLLKITASLLLAFLATASCSDEKPDLPRTKAKDLTFVVSVSIPHFPTSKAIGNFSEEDNQVDEITILLFSPATGGAFVGYAQTDNIEQVSGPDNLNKKRFSVELPSGIYKALFIANANTFIGTKCNLTSKTLTSDGSPITMANIQTELSYSIGSGLGAKYNADPNSGPYAPFISCSDFVDLTIPIPSFVNYETHPIQLVRMVAKINLYNEADPLLTLSQIRLYNYNRNGYVVPQSDWWSYLSPQSLFVPSGMTRPVNINLSDPITYTEINMDGHCVDEIFTFEAPIAADPAQSPCLIINALHVKVNGQDYYDRWYKLNFLKEDANDGNALKHINILRNYSYNLIIKEVNGPGFDTPNDAYMSEPIGLVADLDVFDESGLNEIVYNDLYYLAVDRSKIYFYHEGGEEVLKIFTDFPAGWKLETSGIPGWLSPAPSPGSTTGQNTVISSPVTISTQPNTGAKPRIATFLVTAGPLKKEITVVQFPKANAVIDDLPDYFNKYVGAFWRASSYGERLIRMERSTDEPGVDGPWTATVLEGKEWIVMDTQMTNDMYVEWLPTGFEPMTRNDIDPTFSQLYNVPGVATMVHGNLRAPTASDYQTGDEFIYFRIGLKTTHTPTPAKPARYGVILLWCEATNQTHRIWIRQGEDPDYLMRPQDYGGGGQSWGSPLPRPESVKFSPFNLTANTLNIPVADDNPSKFTAFPSQAGAFFQWVNAGALARIAFDPISVSPAVAWVPPYPPITFWETYKSNHETCPPGYVRPNDGATDDSNPAGSVSGSQVRQSLWLDPATGTGSSISSLTNSISGYYADGFFDRRQIGHCATSQFFSENSAVSTSSNDVAYVGRLFFNPNTDSYSSLFFPFSGLRAYNYSGGDLCLSGNEGYYLTSSTSTPGIGTGGLIWSFIHNRVQSFPLSFPYMNGFSIRCVLPSLQPSVQYVWLSPTNSQKSISITSESNWWISGSPPTNCSSVTPSSGPAGTTFVNLTRSGTIFGDQTFTIQNNNGSTTTVKVDNFYIDNTEELLLPNDQASNTGEYYIDVWGGSQNYFIVSGTGPGGLDMSSWITSATILPNGNLKITAPMSPGQEIRTGTIKLGHVDDPTYQVTFTIVQDFFTNTPPFKFLVIKYTWSGNDVDIAVEVSNSDHPNPIIPFANEPYVWGGGFDYTGGTTGYLAYQRALGYSNFAGLALNGTASTTVVGKTFGNPTQQALIENNLALWGGDATGGQGETVFFNAPMITPESAHNDNSGLPRYIIVDAYCGWWTSSKAGDPVRLTVSTYEGGVMAKTGNTNVDGNNNPGHPQIPVYFSNFYNVADYSVDLMDNSSIINLPIDNVNSWNRVMVVDKAANGSVVLGGDTYNRLKVFREATTHMARITYDRYSRTASIQWMAPIYTGTIILPAAPIVGPVSDTKEESKKP
jgi:hypothetical protein